MTNRFKVPRKAWNGWSDYSRLVFNEVYSTVKNKYKILFPPSAHKLTKQAIEVIAWNTAWVAADIKFTNER